MPDLPSNSVDIEKWLKLIRADGIGPTTFAKLLTHFGSVEKVLGASVAELTKIDGVGFKTALFAGDGRSLRPRESDDRCRGLSPDLIVTDLRQLIAATVNP